MKPARKPMPKLSPIRGVQRKKFAGNRSICFIFHGRKPKFYSVGREILASALFSTGKPTDRTVVVAKLERAHGEFWGFAEALIVKKPGRIEILAADAAKKKAGLNVFRLFINEAATFARAAGVKKITIYAEKELKEYCARLGFEFEEGSIFGVFALR